MLFWGEVDFAPRAHSKERRLRKICTVTFSIADGTTYAPPLRVYVIVCVCVGVFWEHCGVIRCDIVSEGMLRCVSPEATQCADWWSPLVSKRKQKTTLLRSKGCRVCSEI